MRELHNFLFFNYRLIKGVNTHSKKANPNFNDFLNFVANTDSFNSHWSPNVGAICNPCLYHYDYLLKMDTFGSDFINMFAKQGVNILKQKGVMEELQQESHSYYQNILEDVDPKILEKFVERFELDFLLFGYSIDEMKQYYIKSK